MGTRSDIIVQLKDDRWGRIYCHWDGYPSHNGRILFDHYKTQAKVEKLIALGDISSLGEEVGSKHPFDRPSRFIRDTMELNPEYEAYDKRYGRMCNAYGRDRGEKDTEAKFGATLAEVWPAKETFTEYTYVWVRSGKKRPEGHWWMGNPESGPTSVRELKLVLDEIEAEKAAA